MAAGSGLSARLLGALVRTQRPGMRTACDSRVGVGPSVAGGIPGWPVLHRNGFEFSLLLKRKHMPVTSTLAAACVSRRAAVMPSLPCQGGWHRWLWGPLNSATNALPVTPPLCSLRESEEWMWRSPQGSPTSPRPGGRSKSWTSPAPRLACLLRLPRPEPT